jgi:hypothetical protein
MESQDKKLLIKSRGLFKASLTRMQKHLDKHEAGSDTIEIRLRLERMPNILHDYDEVQKQLELYDELGTHDEDRETFDAKYYQK